MLNYIIEEVEFDILHGKRWEGAIMRYTSGKTRIASLIAETIMEREKQNMYKNLVSPFCGGLSVEVKLAPFFDRIVCNDKQKYLINLYLAMQNGWMPPDSLSYEDYYKVKENKEEDRALTAFVGFGCSFGGKWFGGYGRHGVKDNHAKEKSMCLESKRALLRDMEILKNAEFTNLDYRKLELPDGCVVYADPPYRSKMVAYGLNEKFDTDAFWDWVRDNSDRCHIYVSELDAPDDFEVIWSKEILRQIDNCNGNNFVSVEKLFVKRTVP